MWDVNVVRIYTGADNRSYFEELRLPMGEIVQGDRVSQRSELIPTANMLFRENPLGRSEAYHTPKQRQFVITISGAVEITCAGGSRVFGPGDVLFAAARVEHRFEGFSDDFATWVVFYGPPGGEAA